MVQFVYPHPEAGCFAPEVEALRRLGVVCETVPLPEATQLIYRGFTLAKREDYPTDLRYLHDFETSINYLYLSRYYPLIADLTIETLFFDALDATTETALRALGWTEGFVKGEVHALEHIDYGMSLWPQHSFEEMRELFERYRLQVPDGKYAVRRRMAPEALAEEERYFVLNGRIYHRSGIIPELVQEAAQRLSALGGRYYAIDATPDFIVEVNPGESSDRHGDNPPELFAEWLKEAFEA